ncbi:MAG: RluA family pseudouridine synthase [Desulfobacterium sp.]|jgi:23S rRNA pseudouridine1911/1915/1917 synthase|nr:RluA family pseudouridine synthase [Desulfobacterium sp.]
MKIKIEVSEMLMGQRLDVLVTTTANDVTRGAVARAIERGDILVSGRRKKAAYRVKPGEVVEGSVEPETELLPLGESISLDLIYEDPWIVVINKPPGLVVLPGVGNSSGTLLNALIHRFPDLNGANCDAPPRSGIVHRLDKDTSGAILVAKTKRSYEFLQKEFKHRRVRKLYLALVTGLINENQGRIVLPIGRHPIHRKRMSINSKSARPAETRWRVLEQIHGYTLVEVGLKTGRTHQIRVHFSALGYPLVGDRVYGPRKDKQIQTPRQMLHAVSLGFRHPWSGKRVEFFTPVPGDMLEMIELSSNSHSEQSTCSGGHSKA